MKNDEYYKDKDMDFLKRDVFNQPQLSNAYVKQSIDKVINSKDIIGYGDNSTSGNGKSVNGSRIAEKQVTRKEIHHYEPENHTENPLEKPRNTNNSTSVNNS